MNAPEDELKICFEMLSTTQQIDQTKLMEIEDSKVLARFNNLVPGILQTGTTAGNAIQGNAHKIVLIYAFKKGEAYAYTQCPCL